MREMLSLLLVCMAALSANCQTFPQLEQSTSTYSNNSFIDRGIIGQGDSALRCVTDRAGCCSPSEGDWTDPQGGEVYEGVSGSSDLYVTRVSDQGEVRLNRIIGGDFGMWRCDIPDSSGDLQRLYIYLGDANSGELASATVSFTALHSEPNVDPPEFSLTCLSVGGPATTISWQRDSETVEEDSTHQTSQLLTLTTQATQYENRLRVTGREAGQYQCTVSSNRDDFFGAIGSTITSDVFTVLVAGEPARVYAVRHSATSILVAWDSPGGDVTGYKIYYQPSGGSEVTAEVPEGGTESYLLDGLDSGVEYSMSVVALSPHLPSAVVGPVTPTALTPPTVLITDNFAPAFVGSSYTLTCQVYIPNGVTILGHPHVQFEGPGLSVTGSVNGSGGSPFSSIQTVDLTLSSRGDYTCSAQYFVVEDISPKGIDKLTADVMIQPPAITVGVQSSEAAYVGNDVTTECVVSLNGVKDGVDVDVSVSWIKDGSPFTGDSDRVAINHTVTQALGVVVSSTVDFSPLQLSDTAMYTCEAVITPREGNVPSLTDSQTMDLDVVTLSVTVVTSPSSLCILDVAPHNQYSVTCTASASAGETTLVLEVSWQRQTGGSGFFQPLPSFSYTTTGDADRGYESVLTGSETASSTVKLLCTATLTFNGNFEDSSTTTLTVSGPIPPLVPSNVRSSDVQDNRATVQWTLTSIAYTPEMYVVMHGTVQNNLDTTSPEEREDDITAMDVSFSVLLSGLQPATTYYYRVRATTSHGDTESDVDMFETEMRLPDAAPQDFSHSVSDRVSDVTFQWSPPPEGSANGVITHYTVTCDTSSTDSTPSQELSLVVTSLSPGTRYSCSVSASTSAGEGPQSGSIAVLTVPGAPGSLMLSEVGTEPVGLLAEWSVVAGVVTGYTVEVSRMGRGDSLTFSSSDGRFTVTSEAVGGYEPVSVQVAAVNAAGSGPPSSPETDVTPPIPPKAVGDVSTEPVETDTVTVSWERPDFPNGILTGYTVIVLFYQDGSIIDLVHADNVTLSVTIQDGSLGEWPAEREAVLSVCEVRLDLSPHAEAGVPYSVVVVAVNEEGSGEEERLLFYTAELIPGVVQVETPPTRSNSGEFLTLTWQQPDPVLARGIVTGFQVDFTEAVVGEGGQRRRQEGDCQVGMCAVTVGESQGCCLVPVDETSATIIGLDPDKAYNVSVSAINNAGTGQGQTFTVEAITSSDEAGSQIAGIVAGVVVAVLVVVIGVVALVVVCLVYSNHQRHAPESSVISRDSVKWSKAADAMPVSGNVTYDVVSHLQGEDQQQEHQYETVDLNASLQQAISLEPNAAYGTVVL